MTKRKGNRPKMRDGNPANNHNWKLVCSACGAEFANDETINLADGHAQQEHPDVEGIHFTMIWVGKGPAPKSPGRRR